MISPTVRTRGPAIITAINAPMTSDDPATAPQKTASTTHGSFALLVLYVNLRLRVYRRIVARFTGVSLTAVAC